VLGGTIGLLAGLGALAIPGLGPFIAAGPLMAALSGAALGAGVGGLTGALIGMGIPEIEARKYEGKVRGGNLLIAVHTESPEARKRAEQVFKTARAEDISVIDEQAVPQSRV
jgi:tetrahydromethanopterin S-methyltransferase subunit C